MEKDLETPSALKAFMDALHWAYEKAIGEVPILGGAAKLADDHLKNAVIQPIKQLMI